jgi:tetratricopeptide (TPR) repeat protein
LLQQGLAAEAAERLEDILEEAGGPAAPAEEPYLGARYWLGLALRRAGEEGRAKEVLEELYEIDPSYHDVAALLGRRALEDQDDAT